MNKIHNIVGILKVNNKIIYGLNSKKNPYYIFDPIDKNLSKYLVALNDKKLINRNKELYVVINFNEHAKFKYPTGIIKEIIGEVGIEKVEYEKILKYYNVNQKKLKLDKIYNIKGNTKLFDIIEKEDIKDYKDIRDKTIISIDPKGSLDIDDALSYEFIDNTHIIGIHIADVSFWFSKINLYKYVKDKFFTIYCPNKKFNIFPNVLSDHLFSLKAKQDRLALSLFIHLDKNYNIINYNIQKSIINVNKNMTYEQANKKINKKSGNIYELFQLSKLFFKEKEYTNYDSHNMIEKYMLLTNKYVSEYLILFKKKFPLRVHKEPSFQYNISKYNIDNKEVINFLKYYQMESAVYKEYNNKYIDYYHYGLQLKYYTHFTSPIRRFIDIIVHLKVKEILDNKNYNKFPIDYEKVNNQEKRNKKMYRELQSLDIIYHKLHKEIYVGYIIDFEYNLLNIYIPEIKFLYRKKIIDKKLLDINDFKLLNDKIIIKNKINNKEVIFKKLQTINIILYKNNNKLLLTLSDNMDLY
jgi:ribonuclease R